MAEGGVIVDESCHVSAGLLVQLAEGEDRSEQENELIALEAIYENEDLEICKHDNPNGHPPGGVFNIPIYTPDNFYVRMTKDLRRLRMLFHMGRGKTRSEVYNMTGKINSEEKFYLIRRLPPITLNFCYPLNYPSVSPPDFTLSCCWLAKKNLTLLCEKLDAIWNDRKGSPIVSEWFDFLYNDAIRYLSLKSPYDLGMVQFHILSHPPVDQLSGPEYSILRPFDRRGIQTFSSIEDVLPMVLDFNLATCEVCMEEKPGTEFLRLVNCHEHQQCKICCKGWIEAKISDGEVTDLHCPGYKCDKLILPYEVASVVSPEMYQRFDKMLLKTAFDVMTDIMNCPRPFCQIPVLLEDNLGHCPKCQHAFCARCKNAYHGHSPCKLKSEMFALISKEYEAATPQGKKELELRYGKQVVQRAVQETQSHQWLESNSKQCPSCGTFIQKNDGCNKMTCTKCRAFFCWLCQQELSKSNPYAHFQHPASACSERLFEGVDFPEEFMPDFDDEDFLDINPV